ncbi:MAG: DNA polymerase I [Acidobacteria bacterium]|nr:DNA polymerase I [Acidobacteriota bacterium]
MPPPRLFLIDSFGFIFRAFHARARSAATPMRTSTGLPTEAVYIFNSMLRKLVAAHHPEYLAAVFESEGPTLREQEYAEYKANRPEMPPELAAQIPWIARLLEALRVPILQVPGYEADDVIGAISRQAAATGLEVVIVSSDKDMLQLVGERVSMLNPAKDDTWYDPPKVAEFLGVPPAQVADLLALKGDAVDNIPGAPGIGDKGARELVLRFGSVEAALDRAAEVEKRAYRESLENNRDRILLSKRLATIETAAPVEWSLEAVAVREPDRAALTGIYRELEFSSLLRDMEPAPAEHSYRALTGTAEVKEWLAALPPAALVAVCVEAPAGELVLAGAVGLSARPGEGCAVPLERLESVRRLLEDPGRPKAAHDLKATLAELERLGVAARGFTDDVMLGGFLLSADPGGCTLEALAGRPAIREPEARAAAVFELAGRIGAEIERRNLDDLYRLVELPLAPVLGRMERTGIRIDPQAMARLSARMDIEIQRLTAQIHALAGHAFNINSPQQLGKVLFEELGLPAGGRGKGKAPSTAADVLEALAPEYPIAGQVLEYRQLAKLKGTYVDALPALIHPATGRLHTTFNQTGAATGRLSSSNPNLQNIPVRTELGREIRAAFVPREGWQLVVADYSQIELRLLAHFSGDRVLVEAFRNGEDIHTRTAAEVFGVPPLMVTPDQRRNAKTVNFGIVYGQTPFGLAAQLGIDRREAELYIESYFQRYSGVKKWIDRTIAEVRKSGVARTLFGRERPIPDMDNRNPSARGFAERTAVNSPLQGTAADLIKLAMIRIDAELAKPRWQGRMLLQVHDELVFEAPPEEAPALARFAKESMESVQRLEVPLVVDAGLGANWRDAK